MRNQPYNVKFRQIRVGIYTAEIPFFLKYILKQLKQLSFVRLTTLSLMRLSRNSLRDQVRPIILIHIGIRTRSRDQVKQVLS